MKIQMYTDGGARGNPGPAAVGVFICNSEGEAIEELGETIGEATNNVAEYSALIRGLECARDLGATDAECFLDSELVVKQLKGQYKIKNFNLQKLCDQVRKVAQHFQSVSYTHLPREADGMRRADQLVNRALDESIGRARRR
jgi:ribonuclease HI